MTCLRFVLSGMLVLCFYFAFEANVLACECNASVPHAFGEGGNIPANAKGLFLDLPERGDFRIEASLTRDGETQACRSDLQNGPLKNLRELHLLCSLQGAQSLSILISTQARPLHTSTLKVTRASTLPKTWAALSASKAKRMKVRVAQSGSCQDTVGAFGTTLSFSWDPMTEPWSDVALVVPEVDGRPFASQSHHLCDGHLDYIMPMGVEHTHLFATELAVEQQSNTLTSRAVGALVLLPGQPPIRLPSVKVPLPRRLSGSPTTLSTSPPDRQARDADVRRLAAIVDHCRGNEQGEVVAHAKVSGLTGQVLSIQVRAPTIAVSACVRKRVQAQKFDAPGGGKDFEIEVAR